MTNIVTCWDNQYRFFVPVQLCEYVLRKKLSNQFRLYCYLKGSCSGKTRISPQQIRDIATSFSCTSKTILKHLRELQELNWIGYNPKSKYYFIRSFEVVMRDHEFVSRTGAEFEKQYLDTFKNFLAGAVIGYIANTIRKKQAFERKKARSRQKACSSNGYPVSTRLIAKKLNISVGMASKMKTLASKAGYILVTKDYEETGVMYFERKHYLKTFPELAGRLRNRKGRLCIVGTSKILPTIRFKARKKRERIKRQFIPKW